jgi:DNA (cytosine-5)-methyltransferase 1
MSKPPTPSVLPDRELLAVDLFSGCGGLTLGLKLAGFRVIAAVEFDAGAVEAYKLNHQGVTLYDFDICQLRGEQILADAGLKAGELDLLAGCPPCQGFSRMKTLNGKHEDADPGKNDLVYQYLRLVEELQPRALLLENVPALRQDRRYRLLRERVEELGYYVSDEIHDAADFGVPQRRRRLIMLAAKCARPAMPTPVPVEARQSVRQAISAWSATAGVSGDLAHDVPSNRSARVEALIRRIPHDGGSRRDLGADEQLQCHKNCDGFGDVYGRMRWDDVSPTITSGFPNPSKGRFIHPDQDRTLTLREGALLQTFPSDYKFPEHRGKYQVATMIGNALPPRLAEAHASAVAAVLRGEAAQSPV